MLKTIIFIAAISTGHYAMAHSCSEVADNTIEKDRLYAELFTTPNEMLGRAVSSQLWEIWISAPDDEAQDLMDRGRERIRVADYEKAAEYFTKLTEYCPLYAEGWNQRGYVYFLSQNYDASLEDITKALDLEPRHFGALAGRATVLISMGRTEIGYDALRRALALNPWLSERHLLPQGDDI
ncbi:MAG: tetratricopeptide repeat protein [Paracoccaceae bacterium]